MSAKTIRKSLILLLTAAIWGFAFVAQSVGGDVIGPFAFNFSRFVIGAVVLLPIIGIKKISHKDTRAPKAKTDKKNLLVGGLLCGICLCAGSCLQQVGLYFGTNVGKAGFLTACYILIVPIIGLFLKKKCGINVWIGVALALVGLYLLCIKEGFSIKGSDLIVLLCALFFSLQIMVIDHYSPLVDGVRLSCLQFATAGVISFILTIIIDLKGNILGLGGIFTTLFTDMYALIPVLYAGVLSCGVAYTLQIIGQEGLNPTIASLVMSFESVFSVLGGWLILHEKLSVKELVGCGLVFIAIMLAQINFEKK